MENLPNDHNSIKNQSIKGHFVGREVIYCQSSLVEDMLKAGTEGNRDFPSYDDLEGLYNYGEIAGTVYYDEDEIDERLSVITEEIQKLTGLDDPYGLPDMIDEIDESWDKLGPFDKNGIVKPDFHNWLLNKSEAQKLFDEFEALEEAKDNGPEEVAEIYEWWLVTNWFAEKLRGYNEIVLSWNGCQWWGRQTTGQAILLDGVISRICSDMEILEGQKNEWSV